MELCATEVEALVRAMDALSPWIVYRGNSAVAQDLHSEVISLFNKITSFMMKSSQNEAGFHIIVDDDARRYLHTFMLRKAVPIFILRDSLAKPKTSIHDDASIISLAAIKSWTVVGYLPYKDGSWKQKAEELLAEAFFIPAKSATSTATRFIGGYLHHPTARLEALSSLVEDDAGSETSKESDSVSNVSTITSVSMRSG